VRKNGVHIIDLAKTAQQMRLAYNLLYQLGAQKKSVIIIGTKRQARELVKQAAETSGMMHITSRWLGGLMTNWSQVKKSLKDMVDTEAKLAEGSLKGRTKYELVKIEKEVARAKRFFDGIRSMTDLPAALIIIDPGKEKIVVAEAGKVGVPVIALVDTNTNPDLVDIAVPGNDDAVKSIECFLQQMSNAYMAGKAGGVEPSKTSVETTQVVVTTVAETKTTTKPTETTVTAKVVKPDEKAVVEPVVVVEKPKAKVVKASSPKVTKKLVVKEVKKTTKSAKVTKTSAKKKE
jgi:small subunit ribosomal protein S2